MRVLGEGSRWCFCSGGGRSERVKGGIFCSKGPALAAIYAAGGGSGGGVGTGFLIHRNLLLTSHANLPSAAAAEAAEIRLCHDRVPARLAPQRSLTNPCPAKSPFFGTLVLNSRSDKDSVDAEPSEVGADEVGSTLAIEADSDCRFDVYHPVWAVHNDLPADRYADHPISRGTVDWGYFRFVTTQNQLVTVNFDRGQPISGDISRGREKEKEGEEKPGVALLFPRTIRRSRDLSPAGDFFSPRGEKGLGHCTHVPFSCSRFFITSSVLDLTIVGLDILDSDSTSEVPQPHYLKTCFNPNIDLGNVVYLLGHTDKKELAVGEGKVVIATDNLIKLFVDGVAWCSGSAGFDVHGNLAFMVCDPMKLASSPTGRSASSSSSLSWKKDTSMQFGIPIPVICDWLHQHWEGSLDEVSKPKLSKIRSMPAVGNSCASFTLRRVFKAFEEVNDNILSSSPVNRRSKFQLGSSCSANSNAMFSHDENMAVDLSCTHEQGIPTPEIFESPKLISGPLQKKQHAPIQLLDINFPPRAPRSIILPLPLKQMISDEDNVRGPEPGNVPRENDFSPKDVPRVGREGQYKLPPIGTWQEDCCSVQSSSSPLEISELQHEGNGFGSEEDTMYSAETMESRNIPTPKETNLQQVGRSQSCVNYSRWTSTGRMPTAQRSASQKQHALRALTPACKTQSQTSALPQRSHDFNSSTVSSNMKPNSLENPRRPRRRSTVQKPQRWMF
ncbi:hypothetical protein BHM03_00011553 [Ensete ventricosum]|nr:hypothetical protein BHM03_00011553 [Ensete ventricosum]